jgi:hypothetical protein
MSTQFTNRQWRLPNEENKSKVSNYSMDFDSASSDYINVASDPLKDGATNFSFSVWVKVEGTVGSSNMAILEDFQSPAWLLFRYSTSNLHLYFGSTTRIINETLSSLGLDNNNWNHIVVVNEYDNSAIKIYVNGALQYTKTSTQIAYPSNTKPLQIGGNFNYWNGQIDAVSIFNYALSLYGSSSTGIGNPMSLSPKPVAYYPLGDQDAFNGANYLVPNSSLKDYVFDFYNETISSNNFIDINSLNSNILNSSFSIGIWIKKEEKPSFTDNDRIIDLTVDSNTSLQIICDNSSGKFAVNFILSGVSKINQQAFNSFTASANVWNQIVLTWDGSSYVYYFNGQPVTSTSTILVGVGGTGFFLGKRADANNTTFFNGEMSNVQIFNSALPATGSNSVETLYNNGSPLTSMSGFTSLQGWWKLDASATYDSSTNTWTIPDDSTNSNDGTSSGMTQANLVQSDLSFTSGYSPYALDFDGTNDYIDLPSNSTTEPTTAFSLSLWAKWDVLSGIQGLISNGQNRGYLIYSNGTTLQFYVYRVNGGWTSATSSVTLTIDTWLNIAATWDGSDVINIYVNGNLTGTQTGVTTPLYSNNPVIGQYAGNYFNGKLSNYSIWNTELTSAQISEIYNEGVPSNLNNHSAYSNLVSWWQLGSNSSFNTNWTVLDEKGSNNGTSSNMTEASIVDGVGSYANGLSSGMGGDEVIGSAPFSDANSLSINMDVLDRVEDTPS